MEIKINKEIRATEVRLTGVDGEQIGIVSLNEALEKAAKDSGQKYDSKTGETTTTLFKGKVSRLGHKMTVTSVNKDVDIDGLNVKKGQELKVTKKDKKVTLSGDGKSKDITFSTKNDTKDKF